MAASMNFTDLFARIESANKAAESRKVEPPKIDEKPKDVGKDVEYESLYTTCCRVMKCETARSSARMFAAIIYGAHLVRELTIAPKDDKSDVYALVGMPTLQWHKVCRIAQWLEKDNEGSDFALYKSFVESVLSDTKGFVKASKCKEKDAFTKFAANTANLRKLALGSISIELSENLCITELSAVTLAINISNRAGVAVNSNVRAKYFNGNHIKFGEIKTLDALIQACLIVAKPISLKRDGIPETTARSWNHYLIKDNPYKPIASEITAADIVNDCI